MVKSKSREEREVKKCFQSYFTTTLYNFESGSINYIINEQVKYLWDKMCKDIYKNINIRIHLLLISVIPLLIFRAYPRIYL